MKRSDKFLDTEVFTYFNINPKNKATDDCVIRAIAVASDKSYMEVVDALVSIWKKTGYMPTERRNYGKYLESIGFIKCGQPRKLDNTKYTGKEFCEELAQKRNGSPIIAHVGSHHVVAIKENKVHDTWDSTGGAIGVYWKKL